MDTNLHPTNVTVGALYQILPKCAQELNCNQNSNITSQLLMGNTSFDEIGAEHPDMKMGGAWKPEDCQSQWKVAIIVPIRDREENLKVFIHNIIPFLKGQSADFSVFAVEQIGDEIFNKAQTMDAGFVESQKLGEFDCFIFHDVDMVPVNMCNVYKCETKGVRHLGLSRDIHHPHMVYRGCIGGGSAFTKNQFQRINGFTTVMFAWGGEDDDGFFRIYYEHMKLFRHSPEVGNYYSLQHEKFNEKNFPLVYKGEEAITHWKYRKYDGLNTLTYKLVDITKHKVYTRIRISIPGPKTAEDVLPFLTEKRKQFEEMYKNDKQMILDSLQDYIKSDRNSTLNSTSNT